MARPLGGSDSDAPEDSICPGLAFLPLIFRGIALVVPEIEADDYVTPLALQL